MKIFIIGSGGREHSLSWGIINSESFKKNNSELFYTGTSAGLDKFAKNAGTVSSNVNELADFAENNEIDFTIVGPELPLASGIVDEFEKRGLKIFGPTKAAAEIESSKIFAKNFMKQYGIPTAEYRAFSADESGNGYEYLNSIRYPIVIKADGLAAGKGVVIATNYEDAKSTLDLFTKEKTFGNAGDGFVVEEFMTGYEVSLFAITDGENFITLPAAQDHKRIGDGDTGKNTGGMGAYSPLPETMFNAELLRKVENKIIIPVINGMKKENRNYKGCLYCGLMIVKGEPYVIEFNCRFGDPETQAVIPLIKSDLLQMLISSAEGKIKEYKLETYNKYSVCVVISSGGYPGDFEKNKEISGLNNPVNGIHYFHSGTRNSGGKILTNGGRVLSVVAVSEESFKDSVEKCYASVKEIIFDKSYYRKDIGWRLFEK